MLGFASSFILASGGGICLRGGGGGRFCEFPIMIQYSIQAIIATNVETSSTQNRRFNRNESYMTRFFVIFYINTSTRSYAFEIEIVVLKIGTSLK